MEMLEHCRTRENCMTTTQSPARLKARPTPNLLSDFFSFLFHLLALASRGKFPAHFRVGVGVGVRDRSYSKANKDTFGCLDTGVDHLLLIYRHRGSRYSGRIKKHG